MNEKQFKNVRIPNRKFNCGVAIVLLIFSMIYTDKMYANESLSQQNKKQVVGKVIDMNGDPLPGTTITIDGTTSGVITDGDGNFKLDVEESDVLVVSFIGMETQEIPVAGKSSFTIVMQEAASELDEVTVVAFATQKKESVISSISTVRPSELKTPTSNLTTALGGRIAGIVSYQRSGEPGLDNAEFFIRGVTTFGYKKDPLILIDNVELSSSDLARLQVDDIASFSIMKDASATALYGARGANGVILVTTKEGREGKVQFNVRAENSYSMATKKIDIVDPVSYMMLHNEAKLTRGNPRREYSNQQIDATSRGENPYVYPAVNWYDELFKDVTTNQRVNLNLSGGGKVARYYVAGGYTKDRGVLKVDPKNNYNNNIDLQRMQVRANTNINLTSTTELSVKMSGTFEDYTGPIYSGTQVYNMVMAANPVKFPKYYEPTPEFAFAKHSLFGNSGGEGEYLNPYAEMVKGYKDYSQSVMIAQGELKQKLDFITEGLALRMLGSTTRDSYFNIVRNYNPFYYTIGYYDRYQDKYTLSNMNPESGTDFLSTTATNANQRRISTAFYFEGAVDYNRTFMDKHAVSGLLVTTMRETLNSAETNDLQSTLAYRNMGLSGRATYAFDSRYFFEFNFGYNGSERFSRNERFGFFPSIGAGWLVSNEAFWNDQLKQKINKLKFKATYGLVGNDAIGDRNDRFFYLSRVNLIDGDKQPISFGQDFEYRPAGVSISRHANEDITWETSKKVDRKSV